MPTSREGTKDFKMSLAIFSNSVIPLPGLYLGSNYSRSGAHSSDAPKESAVFCARTSIKENKNDTIVIYARVSSSENKSNLESQKNRLINYCNAKGYQVSKVITEIGSGVNDTRPKLEKLLREQNFTKIIVEHKDRLTRFGFNYIKTLLEKNNINIEVVNNVASEKEDLIQDFIGNFRRENYDVFSIVDESSD